jgi:hypothetical protein
MRVRVSLGPGKHLLRFTLDLPSCLPRSCPPLTFAPNPPYGIAASSPQHDQIQFTHIVTDDVACGREAGYW